MERIRANIVDVFAERIFFGEIVVDNCKISAVIESGPENPEMDYIMPGFVDAHVHTESSMLTPDEFARAAAVNGTVAAVTDPHEIANVTGIEGIEYLIHNASASPFHFCFGAPSCVPSTDFETSGARLDHNAVIRLLDMKEVTHLSEVMNVPAVLSGEADMHAKLKAAIERNKPIDGHEPVMIGQKLRQYALNGISTNHECENLDVAKENIAAGIKVLIREGSAAKNYDSLHSLLENHSDMVMFCTDDCHPDYLNQGPLRLLVKRSLSNNYKVWKVLRAACVNPVLHYRTGSGLLRKGDSADFIVVDNLHDINVLATYLRGSRYDSCNPLPVDTEKYAGLNIPNKFERGRISVEDIRISPSNPDEMKLIEVSEGSLITGKSAVRAKMNGKNAVSDQDRDILKMVVLNRYESDSKPAVAFVRGFNIKNGSLASSVAHDSHNIVCVGTSDEYIAQAINAVIDRKGALVCVNAGECSALPLPLGGICSNMDLDDVISAYVKIRDAAKSLGTSFADPFMTMSFLALPVIPWLKLTDKGLFDFAEFNLTTL